jgi:hypothetical protein
MAEDSEKNDVEPQQPAAHSAAMEPGLASQAAQAHERYLRWIDRARKAVAVAMVICAVGFVVCARRGDYIREALGRDPGLWTLGIQVLGIGILACLAATIALIIEHLARPAASKPFALRSMLIRSLFILTVTGAVCFWMVCAYGFWQAIGAATGAFLVFAALRESAWLRMALAVLAVIVLGSTLRGTQSAFQYARRNAAEIVEAGCKLADQCPKTEYHRAVGTYGGALFGQEIDPNDSRVPSVLRKLGARRIWVDDERVAIYVGWDTEFQISREPHPRLHADPVWAQRWKGSTEFTDRLWTNVY